MLTIHLVSRNFSKYIINHNSTGVSSGVSLVKKIELGFESNLGKTDYRVQK